MKRRAAFPFCAVLGQENMKRALLLNVVNPKIGGVLLSGEKGTAKSTVVRALAALLENVSVVELPLNATEDRVVGSIDIQAAVQDGACRFEPGILMAADQNFLYIDEVNLLSDYIVNSLLEAAASGINRVEREGISYTHTSRFYLVGSMNPEEGKLRPQFLDRFGLYVKVEGIRDAGERARIIRRQLEYEKDPEGFVQNFEEEQRALKEKLARAKERLTHVTITEAAMKLAALLSEKAGCAGARAELTIVETGRAMAALDGRTTVNLEDIKQAAQFALPHRARKIEKAETGQETESSGEDAASGKEEESEQSQKNSSGNEAEPAQKKNNVPENKTELEQKEKNSLSEDAEKPDGTAYSDEIDRRVPEKESEKSGEHPDAVLEEEIQKIGQTFEVKNWTGEMAFPAVRNGSGRRSIVHTSSVMGRYVRADFPKGKLWDIAFDATMRAAAPHQKQRTHSNMALVVQKEDIRTKLRERRVGNTILFLVDASGSMGANRRMSAVKGAICSLLNDAYQKRDRVGMIAFRKKSAELILDITRSVELAKKKLELLPTGGRTPLSAGLFLARQVLCSQLQKDPDCLPILVVLSDGRANAAQGTGNPLKEAFREAAKLRGDGIRCIVVDTEEGFLRLGLAAELAKELRADYYKIEDLSSDFLTRIVRRLEEF